MKVSRLKIEHFRCITNATLYFDGHTLLVGMNNVGKSTICEALDLVMGPDRLSKFPPIEEFDFYNAEYLSEDGVTPVGKPVEFSGPTSFWFMTVSIGIIFPFYQTNIIGF